jgi:hypothetical protein
MATRLARFPFVSKADILRAYRPGSGLSERTFRTLREHGWVSPGVVIRHRRPRLFVLTPVGRSGLDDCECRATPQASMAAGTPVGVDRR